MSYVFVGVGALIVGVVGAFFFVRRWIRKDIEKWW